MKAEIPCCVVVPPQISPFDFGDETINSGDMVVVNCMILKGDLPLTIHWTLENHPVDEVSGITVSNSNKRISQLMIDAVDAHHAGSYACHVTNTVGSDSYSAELKINGTEERHSLHVFLLVHQTLMMSRLRFPKLHVDRSL